MKILLLLIRTATVERSFPAMNRILRDMRSCLLPDHTTQLMLLSIKGPEMIDVRNAMDEGKEIRDNLIDRAFKEWLKMQTHLQYM